MGTFILRTHRPRKDGRVSVMYLGFIHNNRVYHGTGIAVHPKDWDEVRQQVRRTDVRYNILNQKLRDIEATFEREAAALDDPSHADVASLKKRLSRRRTEDDLPISNRGKATFWSTYDDFIKAKKSDRVERTVAKYETLRNVLHEFERGYGKLNFDSMSLEFYDAFKKYLLAKRKLTNNTVGKYFSTLKTYLAWAEERGAEVPKHYRKFKVDEEDVEVIALTWDELQRLASLDLAKNTRLDKVRDLFLFSCYTGARFGDVQSLNMDDIKNSTWHLRMGKTKSETRIHLIDQASAIIAKYSKQKKMPEISSQRMNDYLKELGKLAKINEAVRTVRYRGAKRLEERGPKWQFMSSHMARRTFVTLSLERGMRPETVMSFTGHRSFKTMKKYIGLTEKGRRKEIESVWN